VVRSNPERRAALLDAAIETLADEGARGLTFRAVDARAGVPTGTASNYFRHREHLLTEAGERVYARLLAAAAEVEVPRALSDGRELLATLMVATVRRLVDFRSGFLALLELRLEATRREGVRDLLTTRVAADLAANVAAHAEAHLPGDAVTVRLLYQALSWLVVDVLTLPDLLDEDLETLVRETVERLVPAEG
jgi:AcrR family transcriptional regulator